MKRQNSLPFRSKKYSYTNQSNVSTTTSVAVKSILKNTTPFVREKLEGYKNTTKTPAANRGSPSPLLTLDQRFKVTHIQPSINDLSSLMRTSPKRDINDSQCSTVSKTQNLEHSITDSEKRLLGYMDKNKLYINSLREHIRTNSPKKVIFTLPFISIILTTNHRLMYLT